MRVFYIIYIISLFSALPAKLVIHYIYTRPYKYYAALSFVCFWFLFVLLSFRYFYFIIFFSAVPRAKTTTTTTTTAQAQTPTPTTQKQNVIVVRMQRTRSPRTWDVSWVAKVLWLSAQRDVPQRTKAAEDTSVRLKDEGDEHGIGSVKAEKTHTLDKDNGVQGHSKRTFADCLSIDTHATLS